MTTEFIQLSKQQVVSLLVEIAELRAQITDLTKSRDYLENEVTGYKAEISNSYSVRSDLRSENNRLSEKLTAIEKICQGFELDDVCNDCSPRDADHCIGCDAPLEELKDKILETINAGVEE